MAAVGCGLRGSRLRHFSTKASASAMLASIGRNVLGMKDQRAMRVGGWVAVVHSARLLESVLRRSGSGTQERGLWRRGCISITMKLIGIGDRFHVSDGHISGHEGIVARRLDAESVSSGTHAESCA